MTGHEPAPGKLRIVTVDGTCDDCTGHLTVIPAVGVAEPVHDPTCPTKRNPTNLAALLDWIDHDPRTRQTPITDEDEQDDNHQPDEKENQK